MAGGVGSRFWPLSTNACPKQFLDPIGIGKSFIRSTFERFQNILPVQNFLVVTSDIYRDKVLEHIPELDPSQILLEPVRRNTAPCIAYATYRIAKQNPAANIVVAPSDHLITNELQFQEIIQDGLNFVNQSDNLLTIGIKPSRPETGYGYIQFDPQVKVQNINKVKTFTEKPNLDLALAFVNSGEFLWNSGIFLWSVSGITKAFEELLPDIAAQFAEGAPHYGTPTEQQFINSLYPECRNISIDYGIMEKSSTVYVRAGDFGWSDIGTWGSLYNHAPHNPDGNVVSGQVLTYNTKNTIVNIPDGHAAIIDGLEGYMVVSRGRNLLICKLENEQSIRNWVEDLRLQFGQDYI